jgi:hypothetical protein
MNIWRALVGELGDAAVQAMIGLLVLALQLFLYFLSRRTKPNIRFERIDDFDNCAVTFLIRKFDSVRYRGPLVLQLRPRLAIEHVNVHGGPFCKPPCSDERDDSVLVTFTKVPADATFSIRVQQAPGAEVKIWLARSSTLRPRDFDRKLEPFRAARRVSYVLARGLVGVLGFVVMFWTGLLLEGDGPHASDWIFVAAAIPLALVVFVLVVPAGGKPIVAGYLGWSGASRDWRASGR